MNILIKLFVLGYLLLFNRNATEYKYTLICTSKNCTPCITTAEKFFYTHKALPMIINLYSSEADKQITRELIEDYCKNTESKKKIVRNNFSFGRYTFNASDNGPFLIKYSKTDTVIYNASNIDDINFVDHNQ